MTKDAADLWAAYLTAPVRQAAQSRPASEGAAGTPILAPMAGMLKSTADLPTVTVTYVLRTYGMLTQSTPLAPQLYGKAMVWILEDRTAVIIQNDPRGGVVRHVYDVDTVEASPGGMRITFQPPPQLLDSEREIWAETHLDVIAASCICGAGPTGTAMPVVAPEGYRVNLVSAQHVPEWINRR